MEKTIKPEAPVPAAENDDGSMTPTKALNVQIGQLDQNHRRGSQALFRSVPRAMPEFRGVRHLKAVKKSFINCAASRSRTPPMTSGRNWLPGAR